jgi:hypothetical protein
LQWFGPQLQMFLWDFFSMGTVGLALLVGGMALLCSGLIFLIPVRGSRHPPRQPFEDSQERVEQYPREMRRNPEELGSQQSQTPTDKADTN